MKVASTIGRFLWTGGLAILLCGAATADGRAAARPGEAPKILEDLAARLKEKLAQALPRTEKDVVYGEAHGQKLKLDIYFPAGHDPATSPRRPGIVAVHGGGWRGGDKKDMGLVALPLVLDGYVVFSVSYRLFGGGERARNIYPAQLDDCQRAVRWVRAHAVEYGVDPNHLGAIGASAGGHLVALLGTCDTRDNSDAALAKYSSRVQAVVDIFGPTDLTRDFSHLRFGLGTVQKLVDDFLGPGGKPNARDASPLFHIDQTTVPFLIIHGDKDPIVPVEQSRDFHAALQKAGRDSTYVELQNEGHGLGQRGSLAKLLSSTKAFFAKHLRGVSP
jgi:acetyl esterase/lipase